MNSSNDARARLIRLARRESLGFPAGFFEMNAGQFQRNELEFFRSQQPLLGLQFFQALDSEIDEARRAQCAHEIELRDTVSK